MREAKKSLSQNFLIDKNICKKITKLTNINNEIVIEIGPGKGFLTKYILFDKPKKLILIEKDDKLYENLLIDYKKNKSVMLINDDIFNFNFNKFKNVIIISNLPYNISTKIILHLFKYKNNIKEMIFMVQKEVAIKFDYNKINMNKYKFYTKLVSNYKKCFDVSPKVFIPKPKVNSSIVKFIYTKKNIDFEKAEKFSRIIFSSPRKKINSKIKNIDLKYKEVLNKRIDALSIGELLTIYNFF